MIGSENQCHETLRNAVRKEWSHYSLPRFNSRWRSQMEGEYSRRKLHRLPAAVYACTGYEFHFTLCARHHGEPFCCTALADEVVRSLLWSRDHLERVAVFADRRFLDLTKRRLEAADFQSMPCHGSDDHARVMKFRSLSLQLTHNGMRRRRQDRGTPRRSLQTGRAVEDPSAAPAERHGGRSLQMQSVVEDPSAAPAERHGGRSLQFSARR